MTNKEAVEVLQSIKSDFPLPKAAQTRRAQNDALDIAIRALKAEPCENAVSRQAAIDAIDRIFDRCEEIEVHLPEGDHDRTGYKMYPDYMTVWKYLHQLPPAHPEIIRCKNCGHWKRTYGDDQWGVGDCDVFDKHLVMCEGYCAWAERRTDG